MALGPEPRRGGITPGGFGRTAGVISRASWLTDGNYETVRKPLQFAEGVGMSKKSSRAPPASADLPPLEGDLVRPVYVGRLETVADWRRQLASG